MLKIHFVCLHSPPHPKKEQKIFGRTENYVYLCTRYPENNLFYLRKLIPIEDLER